MKSIKVMLLFQVLFYTVSFGQNKSVSTYKGERLFSIGLTSAYNHNFSKVGPGITLSYMHFLGKRIATQLHSSFYIYSFESPMQTQFSFQSAIDYFPHRNFYFGAGLFGYTFVKNTKDEVDLISNRSSVSVMPAIGFIGSKRSINIEIGHCIASDKSGNFTAISVRYVFRKKN